MEDLQHAIRAAAIRPVSTCCLRRMVHVTTTMQLFPCSATAFAVLAQLKKKHGRGDPL